MLLSNHFLQLTDDFDRMYNHFPLKLRTMWPSIAINLVRFAFSKKMMKKNRELEIFHEKYYKNEHLSIGKIIK